MHRRSGDYEFRLSHMETGTPITAGTALSDNLDPANETDRYALAADAGDMFFFDSESGVNFATWRLLDPFGTQLFKTPKGSLAGIRFETTSTFSVRLWPPASL